MNRIKIIIADDHAVFREGIRQILEQEADMCVVGEADNGEEAVKLVAESKPNVALIDVVMPLIDGIEATKRIKAVSPLTTVLILSAYDDEDFIFGLLAAGAAGYLLKSVHSRELVESIRSVYAGESVLHPKIARKVLNLFAQPSIRPKKAVEVLSEREIEVLRLASIGMSNQDIADKLSISLRTVQAHLSHIFNKLQVSSRIEAVVHALKEGWITLEDIP